MSLGSPLDPRTLPLNRKREWREWSGYYAASQYDYLHIHEYVGIRHAAVLIDVSPLYKYAVSGPDAVRLIDRVITRDATKIKPGQVVYTPWCDEHGKVIDDGTIARLDDDTFRWTSAEPHLRWFGLNARGLDVEIEDVSEKTAAIALQGPLAREVLSAATGTDWTDLRFYNRRSTRLGSVAVDVSRTGYTGDLGYELWFDADAGVNGVGSADGGRSAVRHSPGGNARARHGAPRGGPDPDRGRLHVRQARADPEPELLALRDRARAGWSTSTSRRISSAVVRSSARSRRAARRAGWSD